MLRPRLWVHTSEGGSVRWLLVRSSSVTLVRYPHSNGRDEILFRARLMLVNVLMLRGLQGRYHWNGYAGERPSHPSAIHQLNISVLHTNAILARLEREGRDLVPREVDVGQRPAYPLNMSVLCTDSISTNSTPTQYQPLNTHQISESGEAAAKYTAKRIIARTTLSHGSNFGRQIPTKWPKERTPLSQNGSHQKCSRGRCQANMAHIRQARPNYGRAFLVKVLETVEGVPSSLGIGWGGQRDTGLLHRLNAIFY